MAQSQASTARPLKVADDFNADTIKRIEKLELEESKRTRKDAIKNARKRQAVFGCRL